MRTRTLGTVATVVSLIAACASPMRAADGTNPGTDPNGNYPGGDNDPNGVPQAAFDGVVYAHDANNLYQVDPDTLEVGPGTPFQWPADIGYDTMTDIAIDSRGRIVGISFTAIYTVDGENANCRYLGSLSQDFNGLSFVPGYWLDTGEQEVLVAVASDGSLWKLNTDTGEATSLARYSEGYVSSGDIVSVDGFGTVVTVKNTADAEGSGDWLARLDPASGVLTMIGQTGVTDIWGLGYWKSRLYGFTPAGEVVNIDPETGATSLTNDSGIEFWGAGVTTLAPSIE